MLSRQQFHAYQAVRAQGPMNLWYGSPRPREVHRCSAFPHLLVLPFPTTSTAAAVYDEMGACPSAKVPCKSQNLCNNFCEGIAVTY